jgi:hypothetical protein
MRVFAAFVAGLILASAGSEAIGQSPPPSVQKTIHLYGDSIFAGHGFRQDGGDPSFLNSPGGIATQLLADNGRTDIAIRTAGVQDFMSICADVSNWVVKPQDTIVFENAGPHFGRANPYSRWLKLVVYCATHRGSTWVRPPKQLLLTTMFDYNPTYPNSRYDQLLPDGQTVNGATRRIAQHYRTSLLGWNVQMNRARAEFEPTGLLHVVHPDGIHPTVWGNIVLAGSLLRSAGVQPANVEGVVSELLAQQDRLVGAGLNAPFDHDTAQSWVTRLLNR